MVNPMYFKPRSDCNKHILRRWHYTKKKGKVKPKKKFNSIEEAESWINKYKMIGYAAYVCPQCAAVHIGKKQ